jgi:HAD superfamily hydrolase (TIGR01509 family)
MIAPDGWRPDAVVFDCDGLLVDTETCWTVAETELFARRGLPFAAAEKAHLIGASIPGACAWLAERFGDGTTADDVATELIALVDEVVARDAEPMDGAPALVAAVRARVPVAVASNSTRELLDHALTRGGFTTAFAITVAADEVAAPKPDPELYLTACERLEADPSRCLAFEDSATGLAAPRAAGLRTVAVPSLPGARMDADVTLDSLADPALIAWVASWPGGYTRD